VNYALATFEALKETTRMRVTDNQRDRLNIVSGPIGMTVAETNVSKEE